MLKAGQKAPDFALPSADGAVVALSSFRGHKVLLWFFPEAGTPGCTAEGCGFRDAQSYYDDSNIRIVGISFDDPEASRRFAETHGFKFNLLSDRDHSVALAYGACANAKDRQPDRLSYLIDEQGVIERVYDQVDPRDHPARVIADLLEE